MLPRRTAAIVLIISLPLFSANLQAGPVGHVGLYTGQSSVDASGYEKPSSYKLFAGVSFSTYGSLDLAYANLGKFKASGASDTYSDVDGFELTAMGRYPVSTRVDVFARAGYYKWNLDNVLSGTKIGSDDGSDFTLGAGVSFQLSKKIRLQFEYQKYNDISGDDINSVYGGLDFGF